MNNNNNKYNFINFNKNQKLYRVATKPVAASNKTAYFMFGSTGLNKTQKYYSKAQGSYVYTYKTTRPLRLMKLDNIKSVKYLLNEAHKQGNNNIKNSIAKSFEIVNNRVVRNSQTNRNRAVANFVCSLGRFDGYIANELNKTEGGLFHQELVLCDPFEKITLDDSTVSGTAPSMLYNRKAKKARVSNSPIKSPPSIGKRQLLDENFGTPPRRVGGAGAGY